mgnify:CR=1 FL=1
MEVSRQLLNWKHNGFSLDAGNKPVAAHNAEGRRQLAEYLLRAPFSLEKITWVEKTRRVIYRSRRSWRTKRNFEVFTATNPASRTAIQGGRQKEFPSNDGCLLCCLPVPPAVKSMPPNAVSCRVPAPLPMTRI